MDEALVEPLNHWLTQTGQSIGPEGTRSLQARQSITWPDLHTAETHGFNGVCETLNASLHICIDVPFQECRKWRLQSILGVGFGGQKQSRLGAA